MDEDPMRFDDNFKHNNKVKIKQRYEVMQNLNKQKFNDFLAKNNKLLENYPEIQEKN